MSPVSQSARPDLVYRFGVLGAVLPFLVFLLGVAWLGLSGAPDERGFWPVLLAGIACGLLMARDRTAYAEAVLDGMSRPIVLLMVMAWLLAGVLAALLSASGLIESVVVICSGIGVAGGGYAVAAFFVCALVSTATGTSLGTILLCSPLLYPAGIALGAEPPVLIGAILGGATFGDNISPVSDTTIASATTQDADLGGVVRSRLRYALPAAAMATVAYLLLGGSGGAAAHVAPSEAGGTASALWMLLIPVLVVVTLLARQHLLVGLMTGVVGALGLGLLLGLFTGPDVIRIEAESFGARGLIVDGMERGIGVSIFTLLLAGLVGGIERSGLVERLVEWVGRRAATVAGAERAIFAAVSGSVLLTTHSVVAILTVGSLTRRLGERFGIDGYRRSNLLDVTVCTYPFLLPYMIPTILAASTTSGHDGLPAVSPLAVGLHNFHSWALLVMVLVAVFGGFGRRRAAG